MTIRSTGNAVVGGVIRLRISDTGSVTASTPVVASGGDYTTNVNGTGGTSSVSFPDGIELSGTMQLGISQISSATTAQVDVSVIGYEY